MVAGTAAGLAVRARITCAPMPADPSALRPFLPRAMVHDRLWAAARLDEAEARLAAGRGAERLLAEVEERLEASCAEAARRAALPLRLDYPPDLPVSQRREDILRTLAEHRVMVLTGATGSGKTTQLPKMLLESGYGLHGMIALTQPRRVAAVAMAARIAEETAAPPGAVVHSVRFDDRAGADTAVRVMTDGLLLAEASNDRELSRYDAIIIDEAHERSLNIDLLLGLIRLLRRRRPELCVVVSSASIEARRFADYFSQEGAPVPVVEVEGRMFPVDIRWQPPADDDVGYLPAAVQTIRDIHAAREPGDVLCFLPTERDIIEAQRRLDDLGGASILPLFSRLTPHEQQRVFQPARGRKVVLATNIAETSLTIPGIRWVVDTGLARLKRYQASSRTERLPVEAISQASATQRAGRAGRVEAGVCVRLYGEEEFAARDPFTAPEILRSNLAGVLLTCLHMELGDPEAFPWLDAPATGAWMQARQLLDELGAVAGDAPELRLTALGRTLAAIPADPQVARILIAGLLEGVPHEACTLAAFLSVQDPRVRPLGKEAKADAAQRCLVHEAGDLATVLRLWARWEDEASNSRRARLCEELYLGYRRMREWADVRHQLWTALRESRAARQHGDAALPAHGFEDGKWPLDRLHRAVLAGMLGNVLMWDKAAACYKGAGDRQLAVHPGSALRAVQDEAERAERAEQGKARAGVRRSQRPQWLVACEVVETSRLFARLCAPIDPEWVVALAGERLRARHRDPHWDPRRQQVVCLETLTWKGLPVRDGRQVPYERIDPRDATKVFVEQGLCGDEPPALAVVAANHRQFRDAQRLRHRLRDPGLYIEREQLVALYRARLGLGGEQPPVIAATDRLKAWLGEHGEDALRLGLADFTTPEAAQRAEQGSPEQVVMGGRTLRLSYRFSPSDEDDGVTLELVEADLPALDATRLDWLVPAWRGETVEAYLAQLPKDDRRALIPLARSAAELAEALTPFIGRRPLQHALAELLRSRHRIAARFEPTQLPAHLRLRFRLVGGDGKDAYAGRDPSFLATQGAAGGDRLRLLRAEWETAPGASWPGDCVGAVEYLGIRAFVALGRSRDAHGAVAARRTVYASQRAGEAWHQDGVDALLEAALAAELEALALAPVPALLAARCAALGAPAGALRRQLAQRALGDLDRRRVADQAAWEDLLARARAALAGLRLDALLEQAAERADALRRRLKQGAKNLAAASAARGVAATLDRLTAPGWTARLPFASLQRLPLYLDGCARRLDGQGAKGAEERIAALNRAWDDAVPAGGGRMAQATGQSGLLRELAAALEECAYCLATAASGTAAGQAEMRLRSGLEQVERVLGEANARLAGARQRLLEARPLVHRIAVKERREAMQRELDAAIAGIPDLSLGADIDGQVQEAEELARRVRAAL
jgi:ATP-dependent helicase HrpA